MTSISYSPREDGYDFFISNRRGKKYHFKILSFHVPSGLLSVAMELAEETEDYFPRQMEVLSDFDADVELAELQLKAKIKKEINQESLKKGRNGTFDFKDRSLSGIILANGEAGMADPIFAVDGRKITFQQFCKMLSPYCIFKFNFEILDPSE